MIKHKKRVLSILESTATVQDKRYEIGLLWKNKVVNLACNRQLVMCMLEITERKGRKR